MKIALIGYGKMGKAIEAVGKEAGHDFPLIIDVKNRHELRKENLQEIDVAIEFTGPKSAAENIRECLSAGIPVVSGSTGWLEHWKEIIDYCQQVNGCMVYSSNYSIGVNLFFAANIMLARIMKNHPTYRVNIEEIHHTEKKDAPSGTAISLAEDILTTRQDLKGWANADNASNDQLPISSKRIDPTPGTHIVQYKSSIDTLELIHTAHNRTGFAQGALLAADFTRGKRGIFLMKDVLGF